MISDCRRKKLDLIITKSISRFSRNTLDCLIYVRELKELGIGVLFEKENINTLESKGEVLLTILSSLAQEESRSISENCAWGIRKHFEHGEFRLATTRFLGYDQDAEGKLIVNPRQASIVKLIYQEYLNGKSTIYICKSLKEAGIPTWNGTCTWCSSTIINMLQNEKYKGDVLLQKTFSSDFLTKKRIKNTGQLPSYYLKDHHEPIISRELWECAQLETLRRKTFMENYHLACYSRYTAALPMACKIICGTCHHAYVRKIWRRGTQKRLIWQCGEKYRPKAPCDCGNRHIDEKTLWKAFWICFNRILNHLTEYQEKWERQSESENEDLLARYRAKDFMEFLAASHFSSHLTNKRNRHKQKHEWKKSDLIIRLLSYMEIFESGRIVVHFLDGTELVLEGK